MDSIQKKTVLKWNLMLLIGRPLALLGIFLASREFLASPTQATFTNSIGLHLVVLGFVVGWTGKIGKSLFKR